MKKRLVIIGAGGHGKVVAECAKRTEKYTEILLLDDQKVNQTILDFKVVGQINTYKDYLKDSDFIVAIGNNKLRQDLQTELEANNASLATIIDPSAIISDYTTISKGTCIMPGVVVNAVASIGKGCIINTSSVIEHDVCVGDFTHIAPGAKLAGGVHIGDVCWIGINCSILQNVIINKNIVLGANSLVTKDLQVSGIYYGSPAKLIE